MSDGYVLGVIVLLRADYDKLRATEHALPGAFKSELTYSGEFGSGFYAASGWGWVNVGISDLETG